MAQHATSLAKRDYQLVMGAISAICVLFLALGFASWRLYTLEQKVADLQLDLASTTVALEAASGVFSNDIVALRSDTLELSQTLSTTKEDVAWAHTTLTDVQNKVGGVEQVVGSISGQVSTLEKLAKVDSELLAKYSKVFFLNENYQPAHIATIPQNFVYSNTKEERFMAETLPYLGRMLADAHAQQLPLFVKSGFRSFDEQQSVKEQHVITYGAGTANAFSADQGYSEHQLGTTVDLIASGLGGQLSEQFDQTSSYQWLAQNAYRYGFVLSYPKGNQFYDYEPWHWRFVGVELATRLHNEGRYFYDMDQRDIDPYLAKLFD